VADWAKLVDEQIKQAIREGQFSNLPGEGKPLKLDDDPNTPPELRLAHQIMHNNNISPNWIADGKALDEQRGQLIAELNRSAAAYRRALSEADASATPEQRRQRAESYWRGAQKSFREEAARLNRQIIGLNLKLPKSVVHIAHVDVQREIELARGSK
jgi:hypothetical protein